MRTLVVGASDRRARELLLDDPPTDYDASAPHPKNTQTWQGHAPTILVVDDDEEIRNLIRECLLGHGFLVAEAATAEAALDLLEQQNFSVVLVDVRLPGPLDGLGMVRRARTRHPWLKCLFMSGACDAGVVDPLLDDFVAKPFRRADLVGGIFKTMCSTIPR